MTIEEVHAHIKEDLKDELEDVKKYTDMATTAKMAGEDELAFWLWQIAHDEQSHAAWFRQYLAKKSHGFTV